MPVSAIIPAYNEENTVVDIINILKHCRIVNEIIVVSDGSEDRTASKSRNCGVKVLELSENMGKGAAIKRGLEVCQGNIILLLDADLIGLKTQHVNTLVQPVLSGEADMTVGVFSGGRLSTDLAHRISPYLSGQRALKKEILDSISGMEDTGYGIEMALTRYVGKKNIILQEVELEDLTHVTKEEKFGLVPGFLKRLEMYWQILRGYRLARKTRT